MKQFPLKRGDGPYEISYPANGNNNQVVEKKVLFNVKAFGPDDKPNTFVISEDRNNEGGDLRVVAPRIADQIRKSHGYTGVQGLSFFIHQPANRQENKPESFLKEDIEYSRNGPSSRGSVSFSREQLGAIIGEEHVQNGSFATPNKNANPLMSKAFESGLNKEIEPEL